MRDASASGAFLSTSLDLPYLSRVYLQLTVGRRHRASTHVLEAHVIRSAPGGIGIEWCEFAPACIAHLIQVGAEMRPQDSVSASGVPLRICASS